MDRSLSVAIIMLCIMFFGAFIADAGSLIEGDNFQVSREKNTVVRTPDLEPKFTQELSYCIVNETSADFSIFIGDESIWMEPGMYIWGACQNYTDEYALEVESADSPSELLIVVLSCGDIARIQARK
jgi:hypothetical protein